MTAIDVFKQSLTFYIRLFNKIFWLSVASSIVPLINSAIFGTAQPSGLGLLVMMLMSMFFSVYMMSLVHQYSTEQDDSLSSAFSLTVEKVMPVALTSIVMGLFVMLAVIPAGIIGGILASGLSDEVLKSTLMGVVIAIPVCIIMYRCFFAAYYTLVDGLSPVEALKASNQQIKGNKLAFNGFMVLGALTGVYALALLLLNLMIADNPLLLGVFEFGLNVFVLPIFTVFIYRLFVVTKQNQEIDEEL
ncbi:MAG: hypothetical protein V7785_00035 [Bermanella sp.]